MDELSLGMSLIQIVWVNILLSGDNAVVIALACRSLPMAQRRWGIFLGSGAAVLLRIVFTITITELLDVPYLKVVGGLLLLYVAVKLLVPDENAAEVAEHDNLMRAVRTIVIADAVMSLDNVIAIAAAAHGSTWLIVFGLAMSVPLVVLGSNLIVSVIDRFPLLVWGGAAFLGWIAVEMVLTDSSLGEWHRDHLVDTVIMSLGALLVLLLGWVFARRAKARTAAGGSG